MEDVLPMYSLSSVLLPGLQRNPDGPLGGPGASSKPLHQRDFPSSPREARAPPEPRSYLGLSGPRWVHPMPSGGQGRMRHPRAGWPQRPGSHVLITGGPVMSPSLLDVGRLRVPGPGPGEPTSGMPSPPPLTPVL